MNALRRDRFLASNLTYIYFMVDPVGLCWFCCFGFLVVIVVMWLVVWEIVVVVSVVVVGRGGGCVVVVIAVIGCSVMGLGLGMLKKRDREEE